MPDHVAAPLRALARSFPASPRPEGLRWHLDGYVVDYLARGTGTRLVVTFSARMDSYPDARDVQHWGEGFVRKRGVSALHVQPLQSCWYRGRTLESFMQAARDAGLFAAHDRVMTYGGSMGGFGALSFAGITGAQAVLAMNPQTRLGPSVRDWETRFVDADAQDWTHPLCDIPQQAARVELPVLVYDPWLRPDRRQAELAGLTQAVHLHVPFAGHRTPGHLQHMGMLGSLFDQCMEGRVDRADFHLRVRARRSLVAWRTRMLAAARSPARKARIAALLAALPPGR